MDGGGGGVGGWGGGAGVQHHSVMFDLTFDLAVGNLTLESCPGYIPEIIIGWLGGVGVQHHGVTLI